MQGMFKGASRFDGVGIEKWSVSKIKSAQGFWFMFDTVGGGTLPLSSCTKRRIADAWGTNIQACGASVCSWSGETCPVVFAAVRVLACSEEPVLAMAMRLISLHT